MVKKTHAFSLVELSIVLVILGLLAGGILSGQSLIHAAELRSLTTRLSTYRAATYSFRDKYFAMPGDMANATQFWGTAGGSGSDATCFAAQSEGSRVTCNGNGDGQTSLNGSDYSERFSVWKHLANAGLIEGSYSGKSGGPPTAYIPFIGHNVPPGSSGNVFFDFDYQSPQPYIYVTSNTNRNSINIYGYFGGVLGGGLQPEDAWNIDTKLDDGNPVHGMMYTFKRGTALPGQNCPTSDDDNTATYDLAVHNRTCILLTVF